MSNYIPVLLLSTFIFVLLSLCLLFLLCMKDSQLNYYKDEVTRQEKVIREQHGKLCMLDGILRNEIENYKLEWVDLNEIH